MLTLRSTHSHFVRCIKPNHEQVPRRFVNELVLQQLLNSGMVDAVRLLSAGYPTRVSFDQLEKQFKPLAPAKFQRLPPAMFSAALLTAFDLSHKDFLLGLTRAFFKSGKLAFVDSLAERAGALDAKFWEDGPAALALALPPRHRRRALPHLPRGEDAPAARAVEVPPLGQHRQPRRPLVGAPRQRDPLRPRHRGAAGVRPRLHRAAPARAKKARGIAIVQKMGRGYLARVYRDKLRVEREVERKAKRQGRARAQDPRAQGGHGAQGRQEAKDSEAEAPTRRCRAKKKRRRRRASGAAAAEARLRGRTAVRAGRPSR